MCQASCDLWYRIITITSVISSLECISKQYFLPLIYNFYFIVHTNYGKVIGEPEGTINLSKDKEMLLCKIQKQYSWFSLVLIMTLLSITMSTTYDVTPDVIIVTTYSTTCSMRPITSPLTLNYSSYQDYITFLLTLSYKMFTTFHLLVVQLMVQHQTQSSSVNH